MRPRDLWGRGVNRIILGTHILLSRWGHWGSIHLGLPSRSPMFGERALKTPLYSASEPDPELSKIDAVVCRIEADHRSVIIRKYCGQWPTRQFMRHYHWTFNKYCLQLEQSIWAVHIELDANPLLFNDTRGINAKNQHVSVKTDNPQERSLGQR